MRADSAAYQAAIFNHWEAQGQTFAIGADRDAAVVAAIAVLPERAWRPYRDGEISETVHRMNGTAKAFRLVVVRRGRQGELFEAEAPRYRCTVIASNRTENAAATLDWYCRRGDASENRLKELKVGMGLESLPCGQFGANAVFFRIGAVAYNLFKGFLACAFPADWRTHQVQTLRWRLYQTAGKIVRHAGQLDLKVSRAALALCSNPSAHAAGRRP